MTTYFRENLSNLLIHNSLYDTFHHFDRMLTEIETMKTKNNELK